MTRIDINEIMALKSRIRAINSLNLQEIEFMDGDNKVIIPHKLIEDWRFIGMNNCDFIDTGFYLEGWKEEDFMKEGTSSHYFIKPKCKCEYPERTYNEEYDASYCKKCNLWLEKTCGDPTCDFCSTRPDQPGSS